jgi:hypothetical protein
MRVEYPGAIYHGMDRGDRREDIFVDDVDCQDFLNGGRRLISANSEHSHELWASS